MLSVLVAILACYTTLSVVGRFEARASHPFTPPVLLSALIMGLGSHEALTLARWDMLSVAWTFRWGTHSACHWNQHSWDKDVHAEGAHAADHSGDRRRSRHHPDPEL
ncbi:hypothetical protein GCM10008955_38680 [Deinococcus malanensis]|uniref:Uncharacterized protein n=1 Tax=Deinococcus malanensis TaxID=1706855 RepID=A0ABQ2F2C8_9DEIO|nr:hypothetical protein GCM10008955_38680 [Deinococcus malanensis]